MGELDRGSSFRRILREYHMAGRSFAGLHERLLDNLAAARAQPAAEHETIGLRRGISRVGGHLPRSGDDWCSVVLDRSALLDYARMDAVETGVLVMDVVRDARATLRTSPLTLLHCLTAVYGHPASARVRRLFPEGTVPTLTGDDADLIARLRAYEPADMVHTALLAVRSSCWIATHDTAAYHRLGYLRTLSLAHRRAGRT
jgi:hypothetical protein